MAQAGFSHKSRLRYTNPQGEALGAPVAPFYSEIRPQGSVTHNVIFSQEGDLVLNGFFQKNRLWGTDPQGEALGPPWRRSTQK